MENLGFFVFLGMVYVYPFLYLTYTNILLHLYYDMSKEERWINILVSILPIINIVMLCIFMFSAENPMRKMKKFANKVYYCCDCTIDFYQANGLLHEDFGKRTIKCPYCKSTDVEETEEHDELLVKRFNYWRTLNFYNQYNKFNKYFIKKQKSERKKDQMDRFIKLQERKKLVKE